MAIAMKLSDFERPLVWAVVLLAIAVALQILLR